MTPEVDLVCCPNCGSDKLRELSYRYTHQPVHGLKRDGDAEDYSSFDYGDDVLVIGYGCGSCDWIADDGDPLTNEVQATMRAKVDEILAAMPKFVEQPDPDPTTHKRVPYGKCPVCGHYGRDCTGTL